jgi:hypothetical protein
MNATVALIFGIAFAIIAVCGALFAMRQRRSRELRARLGPEDERAPEAKGRRAAEHDLSDRERRARGLDLKPLDPRERARFAESWASVQRRFVDEPGGAVRGARRLLEEMMAQRGYPTESFDDEVALLSVHHPASVQHYRAAQSLAREAGDGDGSTEQQRQAMIHYRALFQELLDSDEGRVARPVAGTTTERMAG